MCPLQYVSTAVLLSVGGTCAGQYVGETASPQRIGTAGSCSRQTIVWGTVCLHTSPASQETHTGKTATLCGPDSGHITYK